MTQELAAEIIKGHPCEESRMALLDHFVGHLRLENNPDGMKEFASQCGFIVASSPMIIDEPEVDLEDSFDELLRENNLVVVQENKYAGFPRIAQ